MSTILSINFSLEIHGGADRFFTELNSLMLDKGERVVTITYRPDNPIYDTRPNYGHYFINKQKYVQGLWKKIKSSGTMFFAPDIIRDLETIILKEKPAIAHIHNIYHRISFHIIDVLNKHGIKIIWWLHDFKWICPNHLLFTKGHLCKKCMHKNYFNAVRYRCQNNSLLQSILVCFFAYYISSKRYAHRIDHFFAPSQSTYSIFKEFDFPISNVSVLPHFSYGTSGISITGPASEMTSPPYALYVGRIEKNKGIFPLIQVFGKSGKPLIIVGAGNYSEEMKKYCAKNGFVNIAFKGYVPPEKLNDYYQGSLFTVLPSLWYEVFGLSIVESFNYAKPVVASDIGSVPEIIEDGKTGLLYRADDEEDLCKKVNWMFANQEKARMMGLNGKRSLSSKYSCDSYWEKLQKLHALLTAKSSAMNIGINASSISPLMGGASFYVLNIVDALVKIDDKNNYVIFCKKSDQTVFSSLPENFRVIDVAPINTFGRLLWEQTILPFYLCRKFNITVLFSPNYTCPVLKAGFASVVTIHDSSFFSFSYLFPRQRRLFKHIIRLSIFCADKVIAVSECTKRDIVKNLKHEEKIRVVYNAAHSRFNPFPEDQRSIDIIRKKYNLNKNYVLFTGLLEPRKNIPRLIEAFAIIQKEIREDLVIAGGGGWWQKDIYDKVCEMNAKERVKILGYVPNTELPVLYKEATLFAFPSLYEGFGIAALEAITCGTPVLASNNSSLPKVVGNAGIFVDPFDVSDIAEKMFKILTAPGLLLKLKSHCGDQARRFSWEITAKNTLSCFTKQ